MSSNKNKKVNSKKPNRISPYWVYVGIVVVILGIQFYTSVSSPVEKTNESRVLEFAKQGDVARMVVINREYVDVYLKEESILKEVHKGVSKKPFGSGKNLGPHYKFTIGDLNIFQQKLDKLRETYNLNFSVDFKKESSWLDGLSWLFPVVIMILIWMFFMRRMSSGMSGGGAGGIFSIGKSKAKMFDENSDVKVSFKDVAGLSEAKEEIEEIVNFLKDPQKYTSLGGKIPKGALLVGPPGTGKTLLAKAVAGEAKVPFFSISGSDFVEMFVGVGASRVRDLFRQAKDKSPAIVFIDEIDAIGRSRSSGQAFSSNDERENTLNQLLTEMDGFDPNVNVIILAATNRAEILDKALLRPGRFDRQIHVDLPELKEREQIFKVHLKPVKAVSDLDVEFLAKQTPGFSGADIANICNEAALIAARKDKKEVGKQDFLDAVDRVIGGLEKKSKVISVAEKRTIAFHEAGHAMVSWLLRYASPLVKVTIVPRGQSLGAAWYLPEERQITTKEQILDEICATLGGRAAERIIFDKVSTGALNDLQKVTKQAQAIVTVYGLNDKVGNITYYDPIRQEHNFTKPYSEHTAKLIDEEISKIVEEQYGRAIQILRQNVEKLVQLAELLLEKEVLFKENLEDLLGKREEKSVEKLEG